MSKIQNLCKLKFGSNNIQQNKIRKISQMAIKTRKIIMIKTGTKNVHDIIDSIKSNHWEFKRDVLILFRAKDRWIHLPVGKWPLHKNDGIRSGSA